MKQAHVFISGSVQGVGYRYFVLTNAQKLGLTGWVRNTKEGGVEAVLQGKKDTIQELIDLCKQGPFMAEVKHIGFEWEEREDQLTNFLIRD